jgi:hypothetical protein
MIILRIPPVIPARILWLALLPLAGMFGIIGQVGSLLLILFLV